MTDEVPADDTAGNAMLQTSAKRSAALLHKAGEKQLMDRTSMLDRSGQGQNSRGMETGHARITQWTLHITRPER
ncbi:MAG TPA: hypothetical protein DIU15_11920 [Deltaproteobacteria bacterium]|nr:hypothetical protein [Deltaproteobacteria bacterium]